jgi:NAD+ dependent glucose-6-phosphate dehydrogenase
MEIAVQAAFELMAQTARISPMTAILITGACGSLGDKVRRHLEAMGKHNLRLFSHRNPDDDPAMIRADLSVYDDTWTRHFEGVDVVVHLAADASHMASWESIQKLNIDMLLNVYMAAFEKKVKRVVFASSNWVLGGHRFDGERLSSETAPHPFHPYGAAKLFGERAGKSFSERFGLSVICLRIGYCQRDVPENRPGPHMRFGHWGQQMWLSDGDWCRAVERSIEAKDVPFAVVNVVSDNAGMRWDMDEGERLIGFRPQDRYVPVVTLGSRCREWAARFRHRKIIKWMGRMRTYGW